MKINIGDYHKSGSKDRAVCVKIGRHDLWSLDCTLAMVIAPALKEFKARKAGHPAQVTKKAWNDILDKMIFAFDIMAKGDHISLCDKESDALVTEGLRLFAEHYQSLWI